ncbi:MAG: DUF4271 domain-containing protein [Bacteroidales bacterium]|nr:DUF4271 domain-containing protein [Bacteroidales bacterium]
MKYRFSYNLFTSIGAFFDYHQTKRMRTEQKELDRQANIYTNLFSFMVMGIFVSFAISVLKIDLPWNNHFLLSTVGSIAAALVLFVNILIWQCFGSVFLIQPVVKEYGYNIFLFNCVQGIFIFPLLLLMPFVPNGLYLIYAIVFTLGLIYLLRIFRFFQIINAKKMPSFYFILYLCTLELLPFIILIKLCVSMVA